MQSNVTQKYIARLEHLIQIGSDLPEMSKQVVSGGNYVTGEKHYRTRHYVPSDEFTEWKTNVLSLLDVVVPESSIHRTSVERINSLANDPGSKKFGVSFLKAILQDFKEGFLDNIEHKIDAELNADFLVQAESLIEKGVAEKSHIPAAVIAGAVLEHGLRSICHSLEPPEPDEANGKRLMLSALIDALKKRGAYNELTAKQLRSFADIRNAAAHGNFDEFTPDQAKNMVAGVGSFLATHAPT
ncbi:hypothetical protein [Sedimenticola selenatireducens]|uniref:DUF4145 domain-containing protein n=1 Tax=Sedimenticola selenatireducens TaxID=191960 RepID=A0A557SEP6_9GAMM|nr:hypothetical protein [Sedimenticola selenatireducens]TVO75899.1 hypothetical protein FHP88_07825 [Sedimenticola selenatireducens]TVT63758.1 MAG: hypothetical protein FHK78_10525 [Sedimenticola selenatireducens]